MESSNLLKVSSWDGGSAKFWRFTLEHIGKAANIKSFDHLFACSNYLKERLKNKTEISLDGNLLVCGPRDALDVNSKGYQLNWRIWTTKNLTLFIFLHYSIMMIENNKLELQSPLQTKEDHCKWRFELNNSIWLKWLRLKRSVTESVEIMAWNRKFTQKVSPNEKVTTKLYFYTSIRLWWSEHPVTWWVIWRRQQVHLKVCRPDTVKTSDWSSGTNTKK